MTSVFGVVRAAAAGGPHGSVVLTIPVDLRNTCGFKKGDRFLAGLDEKGRIVYEQIKPRTKHERVAATNEGPSRRLQHDPVSEVNRSDY